VFERLSFAFASAYLKILKIRLRKKLRQRLRNSLRAEMKEKVEKLLTKKIFPTFLSAENQVTPPATPEPKKS